MQKIAQNCLYRYVSTQVLKTHVTCNTVLQPLTPIYVFNIAELNARLKRMASPSLFGADIQELSLHAVMQSNNRLRFKVHIDRHFSVQKGCLT